MTNPRLPGATPAYGLRGPRQPSTPDPPNPTKTSTRVPYGITKTPAQLAPLGDPLLSPQVKSLPHIVSLAEHDPEQEYVLRFDGGGRLRVQLHEGGDPAAAMNVRLEVPGNDSTAQVETSDASGTVVFTGLEEGDYLLHLEAPGWWSETQLVSVGPDETTLALNVRRRGSFRLHVIQAGLPVADASVSLHSRREGEDPVQWESDGLIKVEPVGWRTDLQGELRVSGLPEGTYDLEAVLPGGQTKTFPVMIEGGENLELTADFSQ